MFDCSLQVAGVREKIVISKVSRQIMEEEEEIAGFLVALKTLGLEEAEIERQFQVFVENPSLRDKLREVVRETLRDRIRQLENKKQHNIRLK